ncbi:MAG: phosphopyruvate hydratase [Candidatus Levyibacteriota bacterium]
MAKIKEIKSSEILDCRGNPTIETAVVLDDGNIGIADCPSGASVGSYEALDLRDHDENRFNGLGILKAIDSVQNIITPKLIGLEVNKQQEIDRLMIELDGTQNKGKLGANAILSVSMAVAKAAAKTSVLPLFSYLKKFIKNSPPVWKIPTPAFNLINGGKHTDGNLILQEFLIIPASSKTYAQSLEIGTSVYRNLKSIIKQKNLLTLVGDEGGFSPNVASSVDALTIMKDAITKAGFNYSFDVFFGLDAAANSFHKDGKYKIKNNADPLSSDELISYYEELNKNFGFLYLEDPLGEDDWNGWTKITQRLSQNTIIVGDDLTVTNPYRLAMAIDKNAITGIVIKPNQIGTVIETLAVIEVARMAGLKIIVSHRSGETNDDFIADLAVAVGADYVKFGAPARGERVAKYNRLLQIEEQLKTL